MSKKLVKSWSNHEEEFLISAVYQAMKEGKQQQVLVKELAIKLDREYLGVKVKLVRLRKEGRLPKYWRPKLPSNARVYVEKKKTIAKPNLARPDWFDSEDLKKRLSSRR